ncbi:MAG: hypothetical protein J6W64_07190 [Bacilli bacterium]|nr:hypothetical protein [Bacilli bacterium]
MTNKELAEEIRSIITDLCEVSGRQDKYALECCDELTKKLEILDILKEHNKVKEFYNPNKVSRADYYLVIPKSMVEITEKEYDKIKEWLESL